MTLSAPPRHHRFPVSIISQAVWIYHRFNTSYRDIEEPLVYRGIQVSYETIRSWSIKFSNHFRDVIKERERKPLDKWHLDEMTVKINGEIFILWRAVDSNGYELDVFLQKRRNKKAAIRFLSRQCLRWYLRYPISYLQLEEMVRERGIDVDHMAIYRWIQYYAPELRGCDGMLGL